MSVIRICCKLHIRNYHYVTQWESEMIHLHGTKGWSLQRMNSWIQRFLFEKKKYTFWQGWILFFGVLNHQGMSTTYMQHEKLWKLFRGPSNKLLLGFTVISDVYRSCIPNETISTVLLDFKAPLGLRNPLTKAAPCKFHGSGGHSKYNCKCKTRPIFTGLRHDKLSQFLTLYMHQ